MVQPRLAQIFRRFDREFRSQAICKFVEFGGYSIPALGDLILKVRFVGVKGQLKRSSDFR